MSCQFARTGGVTMLAAHTPGSEHSGGARQGSRGACQSSPWTVHERLGRAGAELALAWAGGGAIAEEGRTRDGMKEGGRTRRSPTPYDALCLGVPFLNPVSRHGTLKYLDPPYVYNVFKGDKDGFLRAVADAIAHPIESFILDTMRMSSVENRLAAILETEWKKEAAALLAERQASGMGPFARRSCSSKSHED
ncbi:hypothetical protein C8J57DRAFT_1458379 [Mycena rebaudengoi]|nr:hypothetical protein C8J57DRAFT_1458379 [Mycena rebaudengoi]